jgi:tRNA dimethylallyltransferase
MDASQVYRDLRIITARPSCTDEEAVPHRLFGYVDGGEACSAARWADDAKHVIATTQAEGRLPILVGGTGLYLRTLLDGIAPVPEIDSAIRATVRALPLADVYAALSTEDPVAAARLARNDSTRTRRALEVMRSTGKSLSDWHSARSGGIGTVVTIHPLILLPPRDALLKTCDARFDDMLTSGGTDEVRLLLARKLSLDLPVMRAIGVREIAQMIAAPDTANQCVARAKISTRQYAKRQYTWFRNQIPPDWPRHTTQLNNDNINEIVIKLRNNLLTR